MITNNVVMQMSSLQSLIPPDCMSDMLHIEDIACKAGLKRHPSPSGLSVVFDIPFQGSHPQTLFRCLETGTLSGLHIRHLAEYSRTHMDIYDTLVDNRIQGDDVDTLRHAAPRKEGRLPNINGYLKKQIMDLVKQFAYKWAGLDILVSFNVCYAKKGKLDEFSTTNWGFNIRATTANWLQSSNRVPLYSFHKLFKKSGCTSCDHVKTLLQDGVIPESIKWSCFHHRSHVIGCLPTIARQLPQYTAHGTRHFQAVQAAPKTYAFNGHSEYDVLEACESNDAYADGKERKIRKRRCDHGVARQPGAKPRFAESDFHEAVNDMDDEPPSQSIQMPLWRVFESSILDHGVIKIIDEHSLYLRVLMNDFNIDTGEPTMKKFIQVESVLDVSGEIVSTQCQCLFFTESWISVDNDPDMAAHASIDDKWCPHTKLIPDILRRSAADWTDRNASVNATLARSSGILIIDKSDFSRTYLVLVRGDQCPGYVADRGQAAKVYLQLVRGDIWYARCDRIECKVKKVKTESRNNKTTLQCQHLKAVLHDPAVIKDLTVSFPDYVGGAIFGQVQTKEVDSEDAKDGLSDDEVSSELEDNDDDSQLPTRRDPFLCVLYNTVSRRYDTAPSFGQAIIPLEPSLEMRLWSEYRLRGDNIRRDSNGSFFQDNLGYLVSSKQHIPHTEVASCVKCSEHTALKTEADGIFILRNYIGSVKMYVFKLTCPIEGQCTYMLPYNK